MRAISSSCFKVLALFRDWLSREPASSTSGGGRLEFCVGKRESRACSMGRLILTCLDRGLCGCVVSVLVVVTRCE